MSSQKRLIKEIEHIKNNIQSSFIPYQDIEGLENLSSIDYNNQNIKQNYYQITEYSDFKVHFIMKINNYYLNIDIEICNSYPFKPPKVYVNGKNYLRMILYTNIKILNKKDRCLHCDSILKNNWGVCIGICQIIKEIYENISMKINIIEILHIRKIKNKYNLHNISIEKYII